MRGITKADEIVKYAQSQPSLMEANHSKCLRATVTNRSVYHITKDEVESSDQLKILKEREVNTFPGSL